MSDQNMDTGPETEEDTASGGAPERAGDSGATSDTPTEDEDGTPLDNPSGG